MREGTALRTGCVDLHNGKSDDKLCRILVRKPESNSPLEKTKLRWKEYEDEF
jgi:hypothetical protein